MAIGDYPIEYNANVHGPYDPARYYGKPDTPFLDLKVSEVGAWFGRRKKTPVALGHVFVRAYWRWSHRYVFPRRSNMSAVYQAMLGSCLFFYFINSNRFAEHQRAKYH